MSKCRTCRADIIWAVSVSTGGNMPIDREPAELGNIVMERDPARGGFFGDVLTGDDLAAAREKGRPLHLSHFVTCPDHEKWRSEHRTEITGLRVEEE